MTSPKTYHYIDPTPCARWLQYATGACIISILIILGYLVKGVYILYIHNYIPYVSLIHIFEQAGNIERIWRIAHIATILLVLIWTYRASANMHAFQPNPDAPYYATPREAVIDYLIPLFNLFQPSFVMQEIRTKSLQLAADCRADKRYPVFLWWYALLAFALLQFMAKYERTHNGVDTLEAARNHITLLTLSYLPYLISAWLLIHLTHTISQAQKAYAAANNIPSYADTPARDP